MENWGQEQDTIELVVSEVDEQVKEFAMSKFDYKEKKAISNTADKIAKENQRKLFDLLKSGGKKRWDVDEISVSTKTTMGYTVPKTLSDRKQVIEHFLGMGETGYQFITVNSRTLNSYINAELEKDPSFIMPGMALPTPQNSIVVRGLESLRKLFRGDKNE